MHTVQVKTSLRKKEKKTVVQIAKKAVSFQFVGPNMACFNFHTASYHPVSTSLVRNESGSGFRATSVLAVSMSAWMLQC